FYKAYDVATDKKMFAALFKIYFDWLDKSLHPAYFAELDKKYKGDWNKYAEKIFKKSMLADKAKTTEFLNTYDKTKYSKIEKDPAYVLMISIMDNYSTRIKPNYKKCQDNISLMNRTYIKAL